MSDSVEYLQLEPDDDARSVCDQFAFVQSKKVLLILPENGAKLKHELDLILIQREARRHNISFAVVTRDKSVIASAKNLNISTFSSIRASKRNPWKRTGKSIFTNREQKPDDELQSSDLAAVASRRSRRRSPLWIIPDFMFRLLLLCIAIALVVGFVVLFIPSANIRITPERVRIETHETFTISPDITEANLDTRQLPATTLTVTVSTDETVATTGREAILEVPATGSVTFTNVTEQSVTIPIRTTVGTGERSPILFRTTESATVNPGSSIAVSIEAIQSSSGDIGNLGQDEINTIIGPLESDLVVTNSQATTGGNTGLQSTVTRADRERLLSIARGELQEIAYTELLDQLAEGQSLVVETIRITEERNDWTNFSHGVGDISESLTLDMQAQVSATIVDTQLAESAMFDLLTAAQPESYAAIGESYTYEMNGISVDGGLVSVDVSAGMNFEAQPEFSVLQSELAGKSIDDAKKILNRNELISFESPPEIELSVDWFDQMPFLSYRIHFETNEADS